MVACVLRGARGVCVARGAVFAEAVRCAFRVVLPAYGALLSRAARSKKACTTHGEGMCSDLLCTNTLMSRAVLWVVRAVGGAFGLGSLSVGVCFSHVSCFGVSCWGYQAPALHCLLLVAAPHTCSICGLLLCVPWRV